MPLLYLSFITSYKAVSKRTLTLPTCKVHQLQAHVPQLEGLCKVIVQLSHIQGPAAHIRQLQLVGGGSQLGYIEAAVWGK